MGEASDCCLWATCALGTRSGILILHQTPMSRFLTYLEISVFNYILIEVIQVILLPLRKVILLSLSNFSCIRFTLAQVLLRTFDLILSPSRTTTLSWIIRSFGGELFRRRMHSSLLSHRINPIPFYILLTIHPISSLHLPLTQGILIDILRILVLFILIRLLLPLLADSDWVAHAQNLPQPRRPVLHPLQIEGELCISMIGLVVFANRISMLPHHRCMPTLLSLVHSF